MCRFKFFGEWALFMTGYFLKFLESGYYETGYFYLFILNRKFRMTSEFGALRFEVGFGLSHRKQE